MKRPEALPVEEADREEGVAPFFVEPCSRPVAIDGRRLNVLEWGEVGKPAVMLVHGLRDHARNWDWIANELAADYHVIAPDLRGHGDSDWTGVGTYGITDYVIDLADIIDALGLGRLALVCHSLGGVLGLRLTASFPERIAAFCGIECVELPIVRDDQVNPKPFPVRLRGWIEDERKRRARQPRSYPSFAAARERMQEEQPLLDAATIAHLAKHAIVSNPDGSVRWKFDPAVRPRAPEDAKGHDLDDILDAIECPVLLAYGDASWIPIPGEKRLARLRDHRVITFAGASHWLHHQCREEFLREMREFLKARFESQYHA
jgi:pimeloyl-ACP methyl ester carboxylesterase